MPLDNTPLEAPGGGGSDEFSKLLVAANEVIAHMADKGHQEGLDTFQLGLFVQHNMAIGLSKLMLRHFREDATVKSRAAHMLQSELAVLRSVHTRVLAALEEIDPDYTDPEAKEL
jgi:hypothetical protein